MQKANIKDKESMSIRLPINIKHDFRMYCANRNESMNSFFEAAAAKAAREWRIENGKEILEDFSEETQEAIKASMDKEYINSLPSYKNADEMFRALGVK